MIEIECPNCLCLALCVSRATFIKAKNKDLYTHGYIFDTSRLTKSCSFAYYYVNNNADLSFFTMKNLFLKKQGLIL